MKNFIYPLLFSVILASCCQKGYTPYVGGVFLEKRFKEFCFVDCILGESKNQWGPRIYGLRDFSSAETPYKHLSIGLQHKFR